MWLKQLKHNWNMQKTVGVALILFALICAVIFYVDDSVGPVNSASPTKVQLTIANGSGLARIARNLEKAGVIKDAFYFKALTRLMGVDNKLQSGFYEFSTDMSAKEIIKKLTSGQVATNKLTIPEGLTVREMATLVETKTDITATQFMDAARKYKPDFLDTYDVEFPVEGFLFPNTYQIPYNTTADQLIAMMVNEFKEKAGTDTVTVRGRILTKRELITIASYIEEEARRDEDRAKISEVIYNRLDKGMRLQLCSSVLYVLNVKKERLAISDTKIDSPFNTYRNAGLTPGPISNPGLESIEAAIQPADVDYLFYLSTPDGTTYYARTYNEHLRNVKKYLE